MKILSWGIGVQSTTLAVMSALGYLPKLDAVIASDLHWERAITYEMRDFYTKFLEAHGVPVYVIDGGDIQQLGAHEHVHMPFWTSNGGMLKRQCTNHFKIMPVRRFSRELLGYDPSKPPHPGPGAIEQWLGISWDEWTRMSKSDVQFVKNVYPLCDRQITRQDCELFLSEHGLPIPEKSACIGCPFRKASEYLRLWDSEWREVVTFDEAIRKNPLAYHGSTADEIFVYRTSSPLAGVDLEGEARKETTKTFFQPPLCGGYCMV